MTSSDLFATALRSCLDEAAPDLDALVRTSVRRGGRIRRARLALAGLGAAAVVAVAGLGSSALAGHHETAPFASSPSASPSEVLFPGESLTLPSGAKLVSYDANGPIPDVILHAATVVSVTPGPGGPSDVVAYVVDPTPDDLRWLKDHYGDDRVGYTTFAESSPAPTVDRGADAAASELAGLASAAADAAH